MNAVTIRNIADEVKRNARLAAAENGRSLEAELRALLEKTYANRDDRGARLRAMSGKEAIAHLIKVANGAGEGVFYDDEGNFREFDL
jgi:plasmid stability protein